MFTAIKNSILRFIDFFYSPFAKLMDIRTFRYLACGGSNVVIDTLIYFVSYNFILLRQAHSVMGIPFQAHILAFAMSFSVSFPIGFVLSKYIVFPESELKGRIQLFRYALLVGSCIILNVFFLKLFVEFLGWYPTPSKVITTGIVAVFSFFSQRKFTFKVQM